VTDNMGIFRTDVDVEHPARAGGRCLKSRVPSAHLAEFEYLGYGFDGVNGNCDGKKNNTVFSVSSFRNLRQIRIPGTVQPE
jgi:hypothetical protein